MATKEAALYEFFNSFGIPAYPATATPDQAVMPYITYNLVMGSWLDGGVPMEVNLWYRTESEAEPNKKVREMSERIGMGGVRLPCDDGLLWLMRGKPWAQAVEDEDNTIKRRYINITVDYITMD